MKTAIVPAQITSVEDTLAGSLTLTQLVLMIIPVFLAAAVLTLLPPFFGIAVYKLIVLVLLGLPFLFLSLRLNGQVMFYALKSLVVFRLRPRLYLATVDQTLCPVCAALDQANDVESSMLAAQPQSRDIILPLNSSERQQLDASLSGRHVAYFSDKNGGIYAIIE